jgi:hypothetical protein
VDKPHSSDDRYRVVGVIHICLADLVAGCAGRYRQRAALYLILILLCIAIVYMNLPGSGSHLSSLPFTLCLV